MNILILSPHRDDAAFSLALAMKGWLAAGHRVTVLGVFTRSLSAPYSDADTVHPNDLLGYVSAMRRREDAEFRKLLPGLRMVDLNLKDAPLRLRCTADAVYTLAANPEDNAIPKIQKAIAKLDTEEATDAVLLPLGLGHHVDHLVVRDAALGFAANRACAFYEDVPDGIAAGAPIAAEDEIKSLRELNLFREALSEIVLRAREGSADTEAIKRRIVSVYASQIDDAGVKEISRVARSGERVWANPRWLAFFE